MSWYPEQSVYPGPQGAEHPRGNHRRHAGDGRTAAAFDAVLPLLAARDDTALMRYYAGVSHPEIGEIDAAIEQLTAFLAAADPHDALYRDATYQLGMMLAAIGRGTEGLEHLRALRPILAAEYGAASVQVRTLDRRIAQIGLAKDGSFRGVSPIPG